MALISTHDFVSSSLVLNQILDNENLNYSEQARVEELLALVNFTKDN